MTGTQANNSLTIANNSGLQVTLDRQSAIFGGLSITSITVNMAQNQQADSVNVENLLSTTALTINPGSGYASIYVSPTAKRG